MKQDSVLKKLASPKEAAHTIQEIIKTENWAIVYTDLSELQDFIPYFPRDWEKDIAHEVIHLILDIKERINDPRDLVSALSFESFLIITSLVSLPAWEKELSHDFSRLMEEKLPVTLLNDQNIVLMADEIFPVPELICGIITVKDEAFKTPGEVYKAVVNKKAQNERHMLLFSLDSHLAARSAYTEELRILKENPGIHSLVTGFSAAAGSHLYEIRRTFDTIQAHTLSLIQRENTGAEIFLSLQRLRFLMECIMEIPFHGTGLLKKTDIHHLVSGHVKALEYGINHTVTFGNIDQTVFVYTEPGQVLTALFALLSSVKPLVKENTPLHIDCGISEKSGFIELKAETGEDMAALFSGNGIEYTTHTHWPFLYIFKKIVSRIPGSIEINKDSLFIFLPLYEYQDKSPLSSLRKQIHTIKTETVEHTPRPREKTDAAVETGNTTAFMQPVLPLLTKLAGAFREFTGSFSSLAAGASDGQSRHTIKTGSSYCLLLIEDLMTMSAFSVPDTSGPGRTSGEGPAEKTDVPTAFDLAGKILAYRLTDEVQVQFSIPDRLPPVRAGQTAPARLLIQLILALLTETTAPGTGTPRFSISAEEKAPGVVITIEGIPPGIPESFINHLTGHTTMFPAVFTGGSRAESPGETRMHAIQSITRGIDAKIECKELPGNGKEIQIFINTGEDE
jgi:hypothetical protein